MIDEEPHPPPRPKCQSRPLRLLECKTYTHVIHNFVQNSSLLNQHSCMKSKYFFFPWLVLKLIVK